MSTHLTDEAAVCDTIVVLNEGTVRFVGPPDTLAKQANGRAWVQAQPPNAQARASWRQADGRYRILGTQPAPPNAKTVVPTLEDGYLAVVDRVP